MATSITFTGSPEAIALFCKDMSKRKYGGYGDIVPGENYRLTFVNDSETNGYKRAIIGMDWDLEFVDDEAYDALAAISTKIMTGAEVFKKVGRRVVKGLVKRYSKSLEAYIVEYDDGESDEMTRAEVMENMVVHTSEGLPVMCDCIQWVEESGNKAQSFAKVLNTIVETRPSLKDEIPRIFKEITGERVSRGWIAPGLWTLLGETEMEKLYYSKRIIEALYRV